MAAGMATHMTHAMDDEIVNLSGGLFANAPPAPAELISPLPELPQRTRAQRIRARRAEVAHRRGTLAVVGAASAVVAGCLTALALSAMPPRPMAAAAPEKSIAVAPLPARVESLAPSVEVLAPAKAAPAKAPIAMVPAKLAAKPASAPKTVLDAEAPPLPPPDLPASLPAPARPPAAALADVAPSISAAGARVAIAVAASRARSCLEADDPRTSMQVKVTFAPSGRVTTATVNGGPFAGTEVGGCIAKALRTATVGAFEGESVTITSSIRIR